MSILKNFFQGFKKGQKEAAETLAIIPNTLLLSLVYFLGVGLTSIIAKLSGKSFLSKKIDPTVNTYWEKSNISQSNKDLEELYKQF